MANFNTHLSVALIVSTGVGVAGYMIGAYPFGTLLFLIPAGAIGGLLPDIDLDHSRISRIGFNVASILLAIYVVILCDLVRTLSLSDMAVICSLAFLICRFGVFAVFSRITRHRGMVHSVPYMAVLALLCVYVGVHIVKIQFLAWLIAIFVFLGAMVHLLLDEIYSVNIYGLTLKKSFGTALTFFSKKQAVGYIILYGILLLLWQFAPLKKQLYDFILTLTQ